jgi:outer membrane receptor for ferric coprogen and ferric-rhodotorulic acid
MNTRAGQGVHRGFALSALTLALHLGGVSVLAVMGTEVMAAPNVQQYNIAAGSLDTVLNRFAAQNQLDLLVDGRLTIGKKSTGLTGMFSVPQGFAEILEHTGLAVEKKADGYVLIEKKTAQPNPMVASGDTAVSQLPALVVSATESLADQSKNNYAVSRSSSATKLDLALKDTPQSITIITQKQIEEQGLSDVNKILESTPGVTVSNFGVPGAGRVTYYSRGYEINNVMIDGNPTLVSGQRGMELLAGYDTVIYDRVEVTRGSTGLSTGTGDPSASLNFVRKRPSMQAERSAKLSWGSWGKERVELDLSQPFTDDGRIRGRFVAAYEQGNSYIDRIKQESKILYGIVEADVTDKTTVALGGTWYDKDSDDASPHMSALWGDSSYNYGSFDGGEKWNAATDWTYSHMRNWNAFLTVDHHFNDNWKLSTHYQYSRDRPDRKYGLFGSEWYNNLYQVGSYTAGRDRHDAKIQNIDLTLSGKFELFGREAQIATGFNGYYSKMRASIFGEWSTNCSVNNGTSTQRFTKCITLADWQAGNIPYPHYTSAGRKLLYGEYPIDRENGHNDYTEQQYGYFFSTKFAPLERLKVILGARFNHYSYEKKYFTRTGVTQAINSYKYTPDDEWVPYAGLVFDLTPHTTAYASYTGIYKTQLEKDINDEFLPFIEGNSYELGLKSQLFNDRLNLHTAVFRMLEKNIAYQVGQVPRDPATGKQYECTPVYGMSCEIQYADKGPVVGGFEVSAQGAITLKWLINAGYTYLHVNPRDGYERVNADSMVEGTYSYERPRHTVNLSSSYLATDKLTLGGGLRWKSKTTQGVSYCAHGICSDTRDGNRQQALSQGSFWVLDLMARYQINDMLTAGLNVNNVMNRYYKTNDIGSLYGTPRSATVSLAFKF